VLLMQRKGPMRLGEIARETALTAATTSDAVSTLESKGLVEKRRALDDGRALALRLTARGRTAATRATQWPDFLAKAVGTLRDEEQSLFYRALLKTVRQLEVQSHIPPHRMCVTCGYSNRARIRRRRRTIARCSICRWRIRTCAWIARYMKRLTPRRRERPGRSSRSKAESAKKPSRRCHDARCRARWSCAACGF
jgi:DNA-binding MarR family transcriptional regulator